MSSCRHHISVLPVLCVFLFLVRRESALAASAVRHFNRTTSGVVIQYVVAKPDVDAGLRAAGKADEVLVNIESMTGIAVPPDRQRVIRVVVRRSDEPTGYTRSSRQVDAGSAVFQMDICNFDRIAREEIFEAFSKVFLTCSVVARQPSVERGKRPAAVPDWLSVGLAQNMYSSLKSRNAAHVRRQWATGGITTVQELLKPNDRRKCADVRGAYGVVVGWLLSQPDAKILFGRVIDCLAADGTVSAEWLAGHLPGCRSVEDMEESWDKWIFQQRRIIYELGALTPEVINDLRDQLTLCPGTCGVPFEGEITKPLALSELIGLKDEPWIETAAHSKLVTLQLFKAGRPKEVREVVESFCAFLEELAGKRRRDRLDGLLQSAERRMAELDSMVKRQTQYLDAVEKSRQFGNETAAPLSGDQCELEREALRRYVNDVEDRLENGR